MPPDLHRIELPDPAIVVLVGPAGAGKSTFAQRHVPGEDVLSSDTFRALVAGDPDDRSATTPALSLLRRALDERAARRRRTVIDATNLSRRERARYLAVARRHGLSSVAIVFDVPLEVCRQRASHRRERAVPGEVVARQHATLARDLAGIPDEGFDEVVVITSPDDPESLEVRWRPDDAGPPEGDARRPAVIIDLDGTLTSAAWRVPLVKGARRDWPAFFAGMGRDAPVRPLIELAGWMAEHAAILLVTGRPDDHEPAIRRWLAEHEVPYEHLWMRPGGDRRPDTIVKRDRYRTEIAPHYDVVLVIDDRPRVVEMWRDEGLYVLAALDPGLEPLEQIEPTEGDLPGDDGTTQMRRKAASGTS